MDTYDVIVVGGGVSGLTAATYLRQHGQSVLILDKAKRLGGRVASGKIGNQLLDVGVPCTSDDLDLFPSHSASPFALGSGAITNHRDSGAASLCNSWSHEFTWEQGFVTHLDHADSELAVVTEYSGTAFRGRRVILTCPPNQSANLLEFSGLAPPHEFDEIAHTKAILLLVEVAIPEHQVFQPSQVLTEHQRMNSPVTERTAVAFRASARWSEQAWDLDAQNSRAVLLREFALMSPRISVLQSETKRWRYANASSTTKAEFVKVEGPSEIYCAGDGFGDPTLTGVDRAVKSGLAIARHLSG